MKPNLQASITLRRDSCHVFLQLSLDICQSQEIIPWRKKIVKCYITLTIDPLSTENFWARVGRLVSPNPT